MQDLQTFRKLLSQLQKLPYLSSKNLYRVAFALLGKKEEELEAFCQLLLDTKKAVKLCQKCCSWTEFDLCKICDDAARDPQMICVVGTWNDLCSIERSMSFSGVYHVLGGEICPLDGIGPDELHIDALLKRVETDKPTELIFATNLTPEGEATASYIVSKVDGKLGVKVSRLASGVPIGASLEFMDKTTLLKAMSQRQPF